MFNKRLLSNYKDSKEWLPSKINILKSVNNVHRNTTKETRLHNSWSIAIQDNRDNIGNQVRVSCIERGQIAFVDRSPSV